MNQTNQSNQSNQSNQPIDIDQLKAYIKDLSDQEAFEIWLPEKNTLSTKEPICDEYSQDSQNIYIPYMMNDAMECFIILKNATLVGHFDHDLMSETDAALTTGDDNRQLLIIKQGDLNTCTVWFSDAVINRQLYRFDQICHFWKEGYEQWSQLTYIIGTMYDKYLWGGKDVCNSHELSIMKLIEFAPFRAFAPAPELFEELYDNTKEATLLMEQLAKEAHDHSYALLCNLYYHFPSLIVARLLYKRLANKKRYPLYCVIYQAAIKGASAYPARHYMTAKENDKIQILRKKADALMKEKHFEGNYPDYHRENIYVRITEEHPFTIMDWEGITFSQKCMVSVCNGKEKGMNMGFFDGKKISSKVLTLEEFQNFYNA